MTKPRLSRTPIRGLLPAAAICLTITAARAQSDWSPPQLVTELNSSAADTAPHLSIDGLTLHFASFRSGTWQVYSAVRPGRGQAFGVASEVAELASSAVDSGPFLSADGLEIVFESLRPGGQGGFDLMRATRPSPGAPWTVPTFLTELNSSNSEASASMTGDGLELYMLTTGWGAPFAPNNSVAVATRPNRQAAFSAPVIVPELAASQGATDSHRDVHIAPDGLRIWITRFLSSTRRLDVYVAERTRRGQPFGPLRLLTAFSTVGSGRGVNSASVSSDGTEMFLAVDFGTAGSQELMVSDFEGLTGTGVASATSSASLVYTNSAAAGFGYAMALSAGATGFPLGNRTLPLNPDGVFWATLGIDQPGLTMGFLGTLDAQGRAFATVRNPISTLVGVKLWAGAFTLDASAPFGILTLSNAIPLELH